MSTDVEEKLVRHLLRDDGQEDVIIATYAISTGAHRTTALLGSVVPPQHGERLVHGDAAFTGAYVLRAAAQAAAQGYGIALLHSHPKGRGWQLLSGDDHDTESDYARVAIAMTGYPLVGLTLAVKDCRWSARAWADDARPEWAESVRTVGTRLRVSWNDLLRPAPHPNRSQVRTLASWGPEMQAEMARLSVLVVGGGSVGLDVAQRLAATGIERVGVMDFDSVEEVNLDRLIGATRLDARLGLGKVHVAKRLMDQAATGRRGELNAHETSVTDPDGLAIALDYDVVFSCVDRPWPRAVLNGIAYADLIPVIDGGIGIDTFEDGTMRGGIVRTHALVPGRPCMACNGQLLLNEVSLDRNGLLDDPKYIQSAGRDAPPSRQNVAALSASVSASLLAQFVSLVVSPGGQGVPPGLRFSFSVHVLERLSDQKTSPFCNFERAPGEGDRRVRMAEHRDDWRLLVDRRRASARTFRARVWSARGRLAALLYG